MRKRLPEDKLPIFSAHKRNLVRACALRVGQSIAGFDVSMEFRAGRASSLSVRAPRVLYLRPFIGEVSTGCWDRRLNLHQIGLPSRSSGCPEPSTGKPGVNFLKMTFSFR